MNEERYYREENEKGTFVKEYLEPCLIAMDIGVKSVEYTTNEYGDETVKVTYNNGFKHEVNVTCDNLEALIKDVVVRICE